MSLIRRRRLIACALAATAVSAVAVPAVNGSQQSAKTAVVSVNDDYFAPTDVTIKKNSKVKWVWSDLNTNTHNVILTGTHPKGVKKSDYRSGSGAVQLVFTRKFTVPGKYGFICSFHRGVMTQTLTVKK